MNHGVDTEVRDLLAIAETHYKQKDYEEAFNIYAVLWENHFQAMSSWDCYRFAHTLRKLDRPNEAIPICKHIYEQDPQFEFNNNLFAWCIYDIAVKTNPGETEQERQKLLDAVQRITEITQQGQYSPYERAIFSLVRKLKDNCARYPAQQILDWTDLLDPSSLSDETWIAKDPKGRDIEYASNKETWYSHRSKAFLHLRKYEQCLDTCQEALDIITRFHYNNKTWFTWRLAKSLAGLGRRDEALDVFQQVLLVKDEWFVHYEIAQLLFDMGQLSEALSASASAAMCKGELSKKYKVFLLMANILDGLSDSEIALKHLELAVVCWKDLQAQEIPQTMQSLLTRFHISSADSIDLDMAEIHRELKGYWQQYKYAHLPQHVGEIKTILSHGKAGFVKAETGKDYYFDVREFQGPSPRLKPGTKVTFYTEPSFDSKKNQQSERAVHIVVT